MFYDDYLCLVESGKQQIKEVRSKVQPENLETKATPERVWIRPTHSASALSRDWRIKMKKSINHVLLFLSRFLTSLIVFC